MKLLLFILFFQLHLACVTGMHTISSRNPGIYDRKEGYSVVQKSSPIPSSDKPVSSRIFVKKTDIRILPTTESKENGSLYNLKDPRNNYFLKKKFPQIGEYISVKILNRRVPSDEIKEEKVSEEIGVDNEVEQADLEEDKLIKALPSLEPADSSITSVLKTIKMKVEHRYENGDLQLSYHRESVGGDKLHIIKLGAKLPYAVLSDEMKITTNDLTEVYLFDSVNREIIEKRSHDWEDEYSLRISGFSEVKSKVAEQLEDKRKDLQKLREKTLERLKSMGSERRQWAQERDKWIDERLINQKKYKKLSSKSKEQILKIAEQDKLLKEQNKHIEELTRPEEKLGDNAAE